VRGGSHRVIAQHLGIGRMTVVRDLQAPTFPERTGRRETRRSRLTPSQEDILTRGNAGCREARHLFQAIQRHGSTGSSPTVARDVQRLRQAQGLRPRGRRLGPTLPRVVAGRPTPLTTRRATRVVLQPPSNQTDAGPQLLACLTDQQRDLAAAIDLAQGFAVIGRERQPDGVASWLARATASAVAPIRRFATGLRADDEAVKASLRLPWSHGPVAGQINRLKRLKRSMFGHATIDRLSRRCLLAA
jgi:transposase